jgi:hypothetical protein
MAEAATRTTRTDTVGPNGWNIRDEVTQLREWGTSVAYPFPPKHVAATIGAAEDCWLRLWDPSGRISRAHASLTHGTDGWALSDLQSKNGVHLDCGSGSRRTPTWPDDAALRQARSVRRFLRERG